MEKKNQRIPKSGIFFGTRRGCPTFNSSNVRKGIFLMATLMLLFSALPGNPAEKPGVSWTEDRIIALGQAVAPDQALSPGSAKLLARRGAVVDLQRNLLEYIRGVRVDARTTMANYMVHDEVRTFVEGEIRGVEIWKSSWDGDVYSVWGGFSLQTLRRAGASRIAGLASRKVPSYRGKGYSSLVLDVGNLSFEPSLVVSLRSESGKKIYGPEFVDLRCFVEKGMCRYREAPESSPQAFVSSLFASPAWAEEGNPLVLSEDLRINEAGEIVVPAEAAAIIEKNSFDFRIPCDVIIITKTAAVRGFLYSSFAERFSPFLFRKNP